MKRKCRNCSKVLDWRYRADAVWCGDKCRKRHKRENDPISPNSSIAEVPVSPGPVPARSDQRRRRNAPDVPLTAAPGGERSGPPEADPEWHHIALRWYESLETSGQSTFYEDSDWATAYYLAEVMSRSLLQSRLSAHLLAAILQGMSSLLVTEGERRRARLELQTAPEADNSHVDDAIAALVSQLGGQPSEPADNAAGGNS